MPINAFPSQIYTNDSEISYFQNTDFSQWTFLDPNSMLNASKTSWDASTGLYVETNAVTVADDTLQINGSGGTVNAPRFYTPAYYDDGTPVLAGDNFILTVCIEHVGSTANNLSYFNWLLGVSADPSSTTLANIAFNGIGNAWNAWTGPGDVAYVFGMVETEGTYAFTLSPNDTHTIGTAQIAGGGGALIATALNSSDVYETSVCAETITTVYTPTTQQLYLSLFLGAKGTGRTYTAGQGTQVRIRYKFSKMNNASMGL